ncbi:MAG: bifunctional precorrin-2 dehydrogenase/sirohydrochlorin ferrochelatase [Candidatus Hydrothermarchaeales archaeon]
MLPVMLNLKGKKAVVFGGGKVSERRTLKLLNSGAHVKVISKDFTDKLKRAKSEKLELITAEIEKDSVKDFLKGADLILIATSDGHLNDRIEEESHKLGLLVNRADKVSDFVIPAVLDLEGISIAISTKGKSPAVTKAIKRRIKKLITKEDILLVELEEFLKEDLKEKIDDQRKRKEILKEIITKPEIIECLKYDDLNKAKTLVTKYLED